MKALRFYKGSPHPLGATRISQSRFQFSIFSSMATEIVLVLEDTKWKKHEISLSPHIHRTGSIWHIEVEGISDQWSYAFRINGPSLPNTQFNFSNYIADPYAKNIHSPQTFQGERKNSDFVFSYLQNEPFDWQGDLPLNIPADNLIIYEMHVRSFTNDSSSKTKFPGTFLGILEKIDHFKQLGINAIELLPIFEFDETIHPFRNEQYSYLCNYWGYSPINFFSPCRRYAQAKDPCAAIREFKTLVKHLHQAGIEVILDVVFNHTGFEGTSCPLPWIDLPSYYIVNNQGELSNYSGCGNTINTNNPNTTQWILNVLQYWVQEMHIDGFRFDLASVFSRNTEGNYSSTITPILQAISFDPILAKTKLIAEPWDAGGLYELGKFAQIADQWSEWNGFYRDHVKAFLNGDIQKISSFATSITGSQFIYPKASSRNSINYICSHDGFTLRDTVSYIYKHNEENGEDNRDGTNDNYSCNFGVEGDTSDINILALRQQQIKNFFCILFLSQGIPMIQSGDEYGHTAYGNNNRWALDNTKNYFLWDQLSQNTDLFNFLCNLIQFRKDHHDIFGPNFPNHETIMWFNAEGKLQTWAPNAFIACQYTHTRYQLFLAINSGKEPISLTTPPLSQGFLPYEIVLDTSLLGFTQQPLVSSYQLPPHTIVLAKSSRILE